MIFKLKVLIFSFFIFGRFALGNERVPNVTSTDSEKPKKQTNKNSDFQLVFVRDAHHSLIPINITLLAIRFLPQYLTRPDLLHNHLNSLFSLTIFMLNSY